VDGKWRVIARSRKGQTSDRCREPHYGNTRKVRSKRRNASRLLGAAATRQSHAFLCEVQARGSTAPNTPTFLVPALAPLTWVPSTSSLVHIRLRSPLSTVLAGIIAAAFPRRSPPRLLTAVCGLRSAPDRRTRRALLHVSYSCAPPILMAALVTHDPPRTYTAELERPGQSLCPRGMTFMGEVARRPSGRHHKLCRYQRIGLHHRAAYCAASPA
jgi:hypothetical protein